MPRKAMENSLAVTIQCDESARTLDNSIQPQRHEARKDAANILCALRAFAVNQVTRPRHNVWTRFSSPRLQPAALGFFVVARPVSTRFPNRKSFPTPPFNSSTR